MFIFDATALVALLDSYKPVVRVWRRADSERIMLGIPAVAIVEASDQVETTSTGTWTAFLWSPTIAVLPLGESAAVQIGTWPGTPAARHSLWESDHLGWMVLTRDAKLYSDDARVLEL